jgi:hypothetical protein
MFAASFYQRQAAATSVLVFVIAEGLLIACGLAMTFKAYRR